MIAETQREFVYRIRWRPQSMRPGAHTSQRSGMGQLFSGYASLLDHPDPRRLDLNASVRDPYGMLYTRVFRQRAAIPVMLLVDRSASMRFGDKAAFMAAFADATARSATATGDAFGLLTLDDGARALHLPPTFKRGAAQGVIECLQEGPSLGRRLGEPRALATRLPRERALVFLVSDFHWTTRELDGVLDGLARHDVVPVVVWHEREYSALPRRGLMSLQDPETGRRRTLYMRPRLAERLRRAYAERRAYLARQFMRQGRRPLFAGARFDASVLTDHFLRTA